MRIIESLTLIIKQLVPVSISDNSSSVKLEALGLSGDPHHYTKRINADA